MSKPARNDRVRYRATFLDTFGTSLVMIGFCLHFIALHHLGKLDDRIGTGGRSFHA